MAAQKVVALLDADRNCAYPPDFYTSFGRAAGLHPAGCRFESCSGDHFIIMEKKKRTIGSRGIWTSTISGEAFSYQSAYEREFMKFLDEHNIGWIKNKERFPYILDGEVHHYIPDFYLTEWDMYVETKGFLRADDPVKFEAFPQNRTLVLLRYEDLHRLGCKVFPITLKAEDLNKWPMNILRKNEAWQGEGVLNEQLAEKVSSAKFFNLLKPF